MWCVVCVVCRKTDYTATLKVFRVRVLSVAIIIKGWKINKIIFGLKEEDDDSTDKTLENIINKEEMI